MSLIKAPIDGVMILAIYTVKMMVTPSPGQREANSQADERGGHDTLLAGVRPAGSTAEF